MTTIGGAGPAAALVVASSLAVACLAGCGNGGASVSGPTAAGTTGPACLRDATATVCVTPGAAPSAGTAGASPAGTAPTPQPSTTKRASAAGWGGGSRVGTFPTRGTVTGDDGTGPETAQLTGTCDLASDVRTVTAALPNQGTIVIDVTGRGVASVTVKEVGGPTRTAEYLGEDDVLAVVSLTPTTTRVRGALLVPPAGSDAPALRVDATFDC